MKRFVSNNPLIVLTDFLPDIQEQRELRRSLEVRFWHPTMQHRRPVTVETR